MRVGEMKCKDFARLQQFPSKKLTTLAAAAQLVTTEQSFSVATATVSIWLDNTGIAVVAQFNNAFFTNGLADRLIHKVYCVLRIFLHLGRLNFASPMSFKLLATCRANLI